MSFCKNCNKKVSRREYNYCSKCFHVKRAKEFVKPPKPLCQDCGKIIDCRSKRCYSCNSKLKWKNQSFREKIIFVNKTRIRPRNLNHSMNITGDKNPFWKGGIKTLTSGVRELPEYKNWRTACFKRDNYTCKKCNATGDLQVNHKKQFAFIFQEFLKEYSQFSPMEDRTILIRLAINYLPFWDINNGETLCKPCHKEIDVKRTT